MRNLNNSELIAISGAAVTVSEATKDYPFLHVKVTDDSSYPYTKFSYSPSYSAMIRFFPDRVETLGGKLLNSGPGIFKHEGLHIGGIEIKGGMLYLITTY